jgi:hypothetical protein
MIDASLIKSIQSTKMVEVFGKTNKTLASVICVINVIKLSISLKHDY